MQSLTLLCCFVVLMMVSSPVLGGYFHDTPYPVGIFTVDYTCQQINNCPFNNALNMGLLTANNSHPVAQAYPTPFAGFGESGNNLAAADPFHNCFYNYISNFEQPALLALGLTLGTSSDPFYLGGIILGIYPLDPLQTGTEDPYVMIYVPEQTTAYFIFLNSTDINFKRIDDSYGIFSYNITTGVTSYLLSSETVPHKYIAPSAESGTAVYDELSKMIWFNGQGEGGYILGFDTVRGEITHWVKYESTSSLMGCTKWAFDGFSGNIFSVCSNDTQVWLSVVSVADGTAQRIGTLLDGPAYVLINTFSIDPLIGPAYVAWQITDGSGTIAASQFDLNTATIYHQTIMNQTTYPVWMLYGQWLGDE